MVVERGFGGNVVRVILGLQALMIEIGEGDVLIVLGRGIL